MKHTLPLSILITGLGAAVSQIANADFTKLGSQFETELQQRAAATTQAVYDQLLAQGCEESFGEFETIPEGNGTEPTASFTTNKSFIAGVGAQPVFSCTGSTLVVWENVRKLVHTANELTNSGPTDASLSLDIDGLAAALQWTAGEEYSTQESMTKSFNSAQQANLQTRIAALKASSPALAHHASVSASGLNAGDTASDQWSPWGGFLNGSYNTGEQKISALENGFDLDGSEINAGLDYRLNSNWIVGGLIGYREQDIKFDVNSGAVDGKVNMQGWSILPFLLFQNDQWYSSLSAGYQWNDFSTRRDVQFDSQNINVEGADTQAKSTNDSNTVTANWAGGYSFQVNDAFSIEPSIGINYQKVSIGDYTESDANQAGYNLFIEAQTIKSLESYFALKAQYVVNTEHGVYIPYVEIQTVGQKETDTRYVKASYAEIQDFISGDALFSLPTNRPDSDYKVFEFGVAAVLRGASQSTLNGPAAGGIQAFLNYRELADMGIYNQKTISGGIRYEF
ncbi:autotransporter outer membrane beta-barrel domain-containing protein [Simiduia curdlanivorans]|uniref:Autotransporter outer membrane beta-barrel domain-containing protein n=1 Tax=Simiduia curdlanivorans TaxID=1492769 RepID=A0ABV8UZ29_9GAMM|nr:autotransporter outer membrane beta-barrel domain-containing protein [Simiduia curdlanivorans]MDN3640314.1 autotransporter outer membrane beta-barrel domain-containing protein [Simiduia curdlanivorans]